MTTSTHAVVPLSLADALEQAEDIHDLQAVEQVAKLVSQLPGCLDRQNLAALHRFLAMSRIGKLLSTTIKKGRCASTFKRVTLKDIGLSKDASSLYQKIAKIPRPIIEEYVSTMTSTGFSATVRGLLEWASATADNAQEEPPGKSKKKAKESIWDKLEKCLKKLSGILADDRLASTAPLDKGARVAELAEGVQGLLTDLLFELRPPEPRSPINGFKRQGERR